MRTDGFVISSSIGHFLDRAVDSIRNGANLAIVGPRGCGISSVGDLLMLELQNTGIYTFRLDCHSPGTWQENFRALCQHILDSSTNYEDSLVLFIDHASDLPPDQISAIQNAALHWKGRSSVTASSADLINASSGKGMLWFLRKAANHIKRHETKSEADSDLRFRSQVWIGNYDCRSLDDCFKTSLASEPRFIFQMPEYSSEHLLSLYATIADRQESQWGEAILHTLLDWCGTDLSLAESLGKQFYGNWRDSIIYDETVAECIGRWLKTDPLVDRIRGTFRRFDDSTKGYIRLLNSGGKIQNHSPNYNQEPDRCIRNLFVSGLISSNLLPGFYQYRNLTVRLLALQSEPDTQLVDAIDLLRKFSNGRIAAILQDVEVSLRLLALRCFSRMGPDSVRTKFQNTRTVEQAIPTDLRKSLLEWAKETGGPQRQQELGQHLTQYQKAFDASQNLWTRICCFYANDLGIESERGIEPSLAKAVLYITFGELANMLISLDTIVFPRWKGTEVGKDSPGKRWPGYIALLRRLRNQSAHLRNVALQDIEDLLVVVREMRKDIEKYA